LFILDNALQTDPA